jgi:hypothetical protein
MRAKPLAVAHIPEPPRLSQKHGRSDSFSFLKDDQSESKRYMKQKINNLQDKLMDIEIGKSKSQGSIDNENSVSSSPSESKKKKLRWGSTSTIFVPPSDDPSPQQLSDCRQQDPQTIQKSKAPTSGSPNESSHHKSKLEEINQNVFQKV